ncbi:MAG TPA: hypothetical protein DCY13_14205, partial [Verrucomicrobiales bacterium]|nr:hypothetical protein [Verrucomicrobiales bacterium]
EARRRAEQEAAISEAVVQFLNDDLFAGSVEGDGLPGEITVSELFERARTRVEDRFARQPLVEAAIRQALATSLHTLGQYGAAFQESERAFNLRTEALGPDAEATLESMSLHAWLGRYHWDAARCTAVAEETVRRATTSLGRDHPITISAMSRLAWIHYSNRVPHEEIQPLIIETVELARRQPEADPQTFIRSLHLHGRVVRTADREDRFREALDFAQETLGPDHPWSINALGVLAGYLHDAEHNLEEARTLAATALQKHIRLFGDAHPNSIVHRKNLKLICWRLKRWDEGLFHELRHFQLGGREAPSLEHFRHSLSR